MPPMIENSSQSPVFFQPGVYAITPEQKNTDLLITQVQQALQGGVSVVQYRNKTAKPAEKAEQARCLLELCQRFSVPLIINDDVHLAQKIAADGVHLGGDDMSLAKARAILGAKSIIGISCYNDLTKAQDAAQRGANYLAFGSCFSSTTKPSAVRCPPLVLQAALAWLEEFWQEKSRPAAHPHTDGRLTQPALVAIGGITAENGASLVNMGIQSLAVISDLFNAPNIQQRAKQYQQIFTQYQLQGRV